MSIADYTKPRIQKIIDALKFNEDISFANPIPKNHNNISSTYISNNIDNIVGFDNLSILKNPGIVKYFLREGFIFASIDQLDNSATQKYHNKMEQLFQYIKGQIIISRINQLENYSVASLKELVIDKEYKINEITQYDAALIKTLESKHEQLLIEQKIPKELLFEYTCFKKDERILKNYFDNLNKQKEHNIAEYYICLNKIMPLSRKNIKEIYIQSRHEINKFDIDAERIKIQDTISEIGKYIAEKEKQIFDNLSGNNLENIVDWMTKSEFVHYSGYSAIDFRGKIFDAMLSLEVNDRRIKQLKEINKQSNELK